MAGQVCKFTPGYLNTAILKFPAGHQVCVEVYQALAAEGASFRWAPRLSFDPSRAALAGALRLPARGYFYPLDLAETWLLVDPDQNEACSARVASSYGVHCWNTAVTLGLGMPKNALPSSGSYLHQIATDIFGTTAFRPGP